MRYTLTITDKHTGKQVLHQCDVDLARLTRVKQQRMSKHPGRYNCMICHTHMIEVTV